MQEKKHDFKLIEIYLAIVNFILDIQPRIPLQIHPVDLISSPK